MEIDAHDLEMKDDIHFEDNIEQKVKLLDEMKVPLQFSCPNSLVVPNQDCISNLLCQVDQQGDIQFEDTLRRPRIRSKRCMKL